MKSVFIYNGSRCKNSRSREVIDKVINRVNSTYEDELEFNYYDPLTSSIKNCEGCLNCFSNCKCPLDDIDDMKKIRQDIIKADFIIFASPVYAHNVSGDMKIFIDRITYWIHYMRLFNKNGMVLVSNGTNGGKIVIDYLYEMMSHLGISVISAYENDMDSESYIDRSIVNVSKEVIDGLNSPAKTNNILELLYENVKNLWKDIDYAGQHQFMKNNNFFDNNSYEELLSSLKTNSICETK